MRRVPLVMLAEFPHTTTGFEEVNRSKSPEGAAQVLGYIVARLEIYLGAQLSD